MIQIYKPNRNNSGIATGFQASDRDRSLYVSFIRQYSWNAQTQKGSFMENRKKPGFSTLLKFSQVEVAAILDALEQNSGWKTIHVAPNRSTQIILAPGDQAHPGFTFTVNQTEKSDGQKASFFLPLNFGEARLIREYLLHYLHKSFGIKEQSVAQAPTPEAQPTETPQSDEQAVAAETEIQPSPETVVATPANKNW